MHAQTLWRSEEDTRWRALSLNHVRCLSSNKGCQPFSNVIKFSHKWDLNSSPRNGTANTPACQAILLTLFPNSLFCLFFLCASAYGHRYHSICMAIRPHIIGVVFLFPQYESWGWNSSRQPWQLGTLPAEPSHWLCTMDWKDGESWRAWTTRGMSHWVRGFGRFLQCELGVRVGAQTYHSIKALERNKHWEVHLSRTDTCCLLPSHGHYVQVYSRSSVPSPRTWKESHSHLRQLF